MDVAGSRALGSAAQDALAARFEADRVRLRGVLDALLDGELGVLVSPGGRLLLVLRMGFRDGRIRTIEVVADPAALDGMEKELVD